MKGTLPPTDAAAAPTLQEQSDQIAELLLASARRLATDPDVLARTKKLLF